MRFRIPFLLNPKGTFSELLKLAKNKNLKKNHISATKLKNAAPISL